MTSLLDVDVTHRLGDLSLQAKFATPGPVTALFGRSGSGKTTLLNLIAGLIRPDAGRIAFQGDVLVDRAAGAFLPVHKRRFGTVFQDARLFPHLNVRQNLMFGVWFNGRQTVRRDFEQITDLLGIGALLGRWPGSLSGGEKQRVAIGRALLSRPRLLLMDEPLASLDDERKDEILSYIERVKASMQLPIVYVSHSVPEVIRLASHLAIIENGTLQAFGPVGEMLARIGSEAGTGLGEPSALLEAEVTGVDAAFGMASLTTAFGTIETARPDLKPGQRVRLRILASDVILATLRPEAISAQNIIAARVADMQPVPNSGGVRVDVRLSAQGATIVARITRRAGERLHLAVGAPVFAIIKSVAIEM